MAQLHLKQWMLGAGGALLLSGSAFANPQAPESAPPPSPPSSTAMQHQGETVPDQAKSKDIADLKKQAAAFSEAWNAKDAKAISKLFTKDAAILVPTGESSVGQQEIEQQFAKEFQQAGAENAQMQVQVESVRQLKPDLLLADSIHTVTGSPNAPEGQPMEVHAVVVAQKQGNQWRFREVRAINEMPMQQTGVGGSGEEQPPPEQDVGGSGEAVPPEQQPVTPPLEPDTGGSGMETPPTEQPSTGGSGMETQPTEPQPQPDTGGSGLEPQPTEPQQQPNTGGGELEQPQPSQGSQPTY